LNRDLYCDLFVLILGYYDEGSHFSKLLKSCRTSTGNIVCEDSKKDIGKVIAVIKCRDLMITLLMTTPLRYCTFELNLEHFT